MRTLESRIKTSKGVKNSPHYIKVVLANKGKKQTAEHIRKNVESRKKYFDEIGRKTKENKRIKIRFNVFLRDNFTCQYCGRKAPNVELHLDHIFPKSKGGSETINNFTTACAECNLGKSNQII